MASYLSSLVPVVAIIVTILGLITVLATNGSRCPNKVYWGRRFYLLIFMLLAGACLVMALTWPRGILPMSLAIGALFMAMLWHPLTPVEDGDNSI